MAKHDEACLRRREALGAYVCSCGMTDEQVQQATTVAWDERGGVIVSREKSSSLDAVAAACRECGWHSNERNALGAAAQHHDRTGHTVRVEQLTTVTYGDAAKDDGSPLPNSELNRGGAGV